MSSFLFEKELESSLEEVRKKAMCSNIFQMKLEKKIKTGRTSTYINPSQQPSSY
jgi:hypothetical protein